MRRNVYKHTIRGFYFLSEKEFVVTNNQTHFTVTLGKLIQTIYE